jgi:PAS domain S-box-containing protein
MTAKREPKQKSSRGSVHRTQRRVGKRKVANSTPRSRWEAVLSVRGTTRSLPAKARSTRGNAKKSLPPTSTSDVRSLDDGHANGELEAAMLRYADLYDSAPIAYVSFDRVGHIQELNVAATQLLSRARSALIGTPFALRVVKAHSKLFQRHLLRCRSSKTRVQTELHLKNNHGDPIPVQLFSSRTNSLMNDARLLYQTAIIDLRERKAAETALRESEERLAIATNAGKMFTWEIDLRSERVVWSDNAEEILGYPKASFPKKVADTYKLLHPSDASAAMAFWKETVKQGGAFDWQYRHLIPGTGLVWVQSQGIILRDEKGKPVRAVGLSQNITGRKRAEEALLESEQRFRRYFDLGLIGMAITSPNKGLLEVNEKLCTILGYSRDELLRKTWAELTHPDDLAADLANFNKVMAGEMDGYTIDKRWICKDGAVIDSTISVKAVRNEQGTVQYFVGLLEDITDWKRAEQSLANAARQQQALFEFVQRRHEANSMDDICVAALDAIFSAVGCDRASILLFDGKGVMRFVRWRGLSARYRKAVEGHSPWKSGARNAQPICLADVDTAGIPDSLKSAIRAEGIRATAFLPLMAEGKLIGKFLTYYDRPHAFSDNELNLSLTIAGQLALGLERKRAEESLRQSEEVHRALVSQTAVGMVRTNLKGKLIFVNRKFCEMLGYEEAEELVGKSIRDITHPGDVGESLTLFRQLVANGSPYRLDKRYLRKDGSILWANVSASPMRDAAGKTQAGVAVVLDIGERKQAEAVLEGAKVLLETRVHERTSELLAANEELQNEIALRKRLEREILEVSDREQRRLGQDLHDSLCQHLTAVAFMTRAMGERLKFGKQVNPKEVDNICALINEGVTEARTIARGLHPVEMDPAGLHTALHSLLKRQSRVPYRLDMDDEISISDPSVALHLYRIAREAVINANKHAAAREIIVRMRDSGKRIELTITDDGIGIAASSGDGSGMGFQIMDYRARSIGARLEIKPVKPHGTRVACYLPRR